MVNEVPIPAALAQATIVREGDAGRDWLAELPSIVAATCERWDCAPDGDPWHGQLALVVPVRQASGPAVLKISFPHPANRGEADALRCFDGRGAVRLMDADDSRHALLLERADPATLAEQLLRGADLAVEEAIEIAGDLARQLAVAAPAGIARLSNTTADWENQLDQQLAAAPDLLPASVIDRARQTIRHLATDGTQTMTHGDLHFGNVLRSRRQPWLTIDPTGLSGTAAWDAFTVVAGGREALQRGDLYRQIVGRIHRYAGAAQVDADLSLACCQARAVSSYLYQHLAASGDWFDLEFLSSLAHGA